MTPPIRLAGLTLYKLQEVSTETGVSTKTLRKYLQEGDLKGRKVGGLWWVTGESLKEFFRKSSKAKAVPRREKQSVGKRKKK